MASYLVSVQGTINGKFLIEADSEDEARNNWESGTMQQVDVIDQVVTSTTLVE